MATIIHYRFPARSKKYPAVTLHWYDGGLLPERPEELEPTRSFGNDDGLYIIGEKAKILGHRPIPEAKAKEIGKPPQTRPRSPGHYKEWIDACKGGKPAGSNFVDHAAHLAEVVLLGNIAIRIKEKLLWDGPNLRFTNSDEAYINPPYREGWTL
jgi:hypothetical protein